MTLSELADRVEAATGPDRELDLLIWRVADPVNATDCLDVNCAKPLPWLHLYTSSLDAAMTLYVHLPERVPSCPRKALAEALRQRSGRSV